MELEVIAVQPPVTSVEQTVGANGRRRTRSTYTLAELPDGGTDVRFELAFLDVPLSERLAAPLIRSYMKRANAKAMQRLGELLARGNPPRGGDLGPLPSRSRAA